MSGETSADTNGKSDQSSSQDGADDAFDDLLRAAVSPLDALEPVIQPDQFVRLPAGAKVSDRFVVEWCVGAGGMGDVYRCQDLETQRPAALKIIRRVDDHSRFRREASILAALWHDAIVRYLAHGNTDPGTPYLAMEWLEGEDLARVLARSALSIPDTLTLMRRACEALSLAHRHGFIHRDIKPSNLFVCHNRVSETKVLDFGVAHRGLAAQTSTRAGTMLGTVGYMSPEQAWGMPSPDPRDDLFSLGCVAFECLTGRPAFAGESSVAVLEAVLQVEPPDVRSFTPDVPEQLAELVQRLLRKDRKDRPPDSEAVKHVLDTLEMKRSQSVAPAAQESSLLQASTPKYAVLVYAQGLAPDSASGPATALAESFAAEQLDARANTRSFALTTSAETKLVDVAERVLHFAIALHDALPDLALAVSAPTGNVAGVPNAAWIDLSAAKLDAMRPGSVLLDPTTALLYRMRHETSARPLPAAVLLEHTVDLASPRFVGREAELAVLEAMFDECRTDGVASAVFVTAPSGFGKSRLLTEFLSLITREDLVSVMTVRAAHGAQNTPLSTLQSLAPETLASNSRDVESSFVSMIERTCARSPVILTIDDAQWSDLESMRVIASLVGSEIELPILVICASRVPMRAELRAIWQSTGAREISLRPLSARSAERYVRSIGGDSQHAKETNALANGNLQLLAGLLAADGAHDRAPIDAAVALLSERLGDLPQSELAVLCAASVFADRFSASGVAAILESHSDVARDVATLCKDGLLVELQSTKPAAESELTFAHPLVRDAADRCLSDADRRRLRERAMRCVSSTRFDLTALRVRD